MTLHRPLRRRAALAALPLLTAAAAAAAAPALAAPAAGSKPTATAVPRQTTAAPTTRLVAGGIAAVAGSPVTTWARVRADNGEVTEVGVTLPISLARTPPAKPGDGPLGAVAVVPFPREARQTTYFDHFELHWNPNGHPPACCANVAHYDLHFYGVPLALVKQVVPPDTAAPSPERLPAGYLYPGVNECVPEMGVHAMLPGDLAPGYRLTQDMVAGFYQGRMTFVEPMISQKVLLARRSFALAVPRPAELGRATRYPTRFAATFDPAARAWRFVYSDFTSYAR